MFPPGLSQYPVRRLIISGVAAEAGTVWNSSGLHHSISSTPGTIKPKLFLTNPLALAPLGVL